MADQRRPRRHRLRCGQAALIRLSRGPPGPLLIAGISPPLSPDRDGTNGPAQTAETFRSFPALAWSPIPARPGITITFRGPAPV